MLCHVGFSLKGKIVITLVMLGFATMTALHSYDLYRHLEDDIQNKTKELVEVAHSVLRAEYALEQQGKVSRAAAQAHAITIVKQLRYREKEYFWIHDHTTHMIMHPYKPELDGQDISGYKDPNGTNLFVEMEKVVKAYGEGFVDYLWPKPGQHDPMPKISFVKDFKPWGWTIGSGVYVDEIRQHVMDALISDMIMGGIVIAVVLYVLLAIVQDVVNTTSQVGRVMQRLADGDLEVPISGTQRRDELGQMARSVDIFRTRFLEIREIQQQVDRAKSEFLSNMSHELRTPMHAIMNYASMAQKRVQTVTPDEKTDKYLHNISLAAQRLLRVINDLLDLSKMEAGKMSFEFARVDLAHVLDSATSELDPLLKEKDIHMDVQGADAKMVAELDRCRITQLMVNLLANAIRYSPPTGTITVRFATASHPANPQEQVVSCSIHDQGIGIPQDELESIFDKFVQSTKTKSNAGGTGLGLSICRQIMDAHHGKIWAENAKEGGACFHFWIPLTQPAKA
jgi:signal transduction histidine kinase